MKPLIPFAIVALLAGLAPGASGQTTAIRLTLNEAIARGFAHNDRLDEMTARVEAARAVAKNQNVFLGGHSAGTGFTARYAATDFDSTGLGPEQPGYGKLRGLVLLEGGGGSTSGPALTADTLDRIEAKYDGGLFGAVRDNAGRCVDGTTHTSLTVGPIERGAPYRAWIVSANKEGAFSQVASQIAFACP